ncbi:MAG: hypothetical protein NTZ80_02925 [Patescibacteria group bacterium]|nr:hypothetical protein [Patescibacteria group bacterium]
MTLEILNQVKSVFWVQIAKAITIDESLNKLQPENVPQEKSFFILLGKIINFCMELIGFFLLLVILYAAVQMLIAQGDDDKIKDARQMLVYAVLGVILVALSIALTRWLLVGSPFDVTAVTGS